MNVEDGGLEILSEQRPIDRRRLFRAGALGLATFVTGSVLRQPFGRAAAQMVAVPAPPDVTVQMLQTAASLENLAVATYAAALELPFVQEIPLLRQFTETTLAQHSEHGASFNAQAERLGGARQDAPNPKYAPFVQATTPTLSDATGVIGLAATLEEVAMDTYLANLTRLPDAEMRTLMASVMCVEAQHLATLQTFGALIAAGTPQLVAIPTDLSALPAAAGHAAFPLALELANFASPPAEGAVR